MANATAAPTLQATARRIVDDDCSKFDGTEIIETEMWILGIGLTVGVAVMLLLLREWWPIAVVAAVLDGCDGDGGGDG